MAPHPPVKCADVWDSEPLVDLVQAFRHSDCLTSPVVVFFEGGGCLQRHFQRSRYEYWSRHFKAFTVFTSGKLTYTWDDNLGSSAIPMWVVTLEFHTLSP